MILKFKNIPIIDEFSDFTVLNVIFYSMFIGVKKSMDLWVQDKVFNDFKVFCDKYNIYLKYDVKFVKTDNYDLYSKVIGNELLTTTKTIGKRVDSKEKGVIHCFISMDKKALDNLYKFGWYPVVVGDRVIYKNYHDLVEFGEYLGYPSCCTKHFFQKNDWRFYNFPYEIFKNSEIYDYRCNPFWKDYRGISYIYHMPCSFGCTETIGYVDKIIKNLEKSEPDNVKKIEKFLLFPILSIREQKIYAFDGVVSDDNLSIKYKKYYHLGKKMEGDMSDILDKGNIVKIEGKFVNIYKNEEIIFSYNTLDSREIENPFIVKFNKYK